MVKKKVSVNTAPARALVLNLGTFLSGPLVGEVHDRIGPKRSCAVAALLGGLGYSLVAAAVTQPAGTAFNSLPFLSVAFFMVGVSSPLAFVSAMFTATTVLSVQMRPIAVLAVFSRGLDVDRFPKALPSSSTTLQAADQNIHTGPPPPH